MLWDKEHSQIVFRVILKKIHTGSRFNKYSRYERSWILKIACEHLIKFCQQNPQRLSPEEQIRLDGGESLSIRFNQFSSYFHRLLPEDQLLLLLKDKHQIPTSEIASALDIPEGSLKIRRQHALRALEEWLWNGK
jgi:DNA-directed RNA polymerase specialized sigma24 family protein